MAWVGASRSMNVRAEARSISWGSVSERSTSASPEGGLAFVAPRVVALGLVFRQLQRREAIEIHERGIRQVGDVEPAQQRLLREPGRERRQGGHVGRDLER